MQNIHIPGLIDKLPGLYPEPRLEPAEGIQPPH
jgi:hypothetical protein